MSEEEIDRKITLIFATDVVGYRRRRLGGQPNHFSIFTIGQLVIMLLAPMQEPEYFKVPLTSIKIMQQ